MIALLDAISEISFYNNIKSLAVYMPGRLPKTNDLLIPFREHIKRKSGSPDDGFRDRYRKCFRLYKRYSSGREIRSLFPRNLHTAIIYVDTGEVNIFESSSPFLFFLNSLQTLETLTISTRILRLERGLCTRDEDPFDYCFPNMKRVYLRQSNWWCAKDVLMITYMFPNLEHLTFDNSIWATRAISLPVCNSTSDNPYRQLSSLKRLKTMRVTWCKSPEYAATVNWVRYANEGLKIHSTLKKEVTELIEAGLHDLEDIVFLEPYDLSSWECFEEGHYRDRKVLRFNTVRKEEGWYLRWAEGTTKAKNDDPPSEHPWDTKLWCENKAKFGEWHSNPDECYPYSEDKS
ncbi:hypothetical protein TWF694_004348 [Orbilia ellipsospora]